MIQQIYYFGYSMSMVNHLINNKKYEIVAVITQKEKCSEEFLYICDKNKISVYMVSSGAELEDLCKTPITCNGIMYEFGIIIPEDLCKKMRIINFHPGSLYDNRGANPIGWSILTIGLGAEICAYRIDKEIDCGDVIIRKQESVSDQDTPITLKNKLEKNIPDMLDVVYEYFNAKIPFHTERIEGGIYRKRIKPKDYTIHLDKDPTQVIIRKINSQVPYNGAILFVGGKTEMRVIGYEKEGEEISSLIMKDKSKYRIEELRCMEKETRT